MPVSFCRALVSLFTSKPPCLFLLEKLNQFEINLAPRALSVAIFYPDYFAQQTETKWRTVIAVQYLHSGFLLKEGRGFYFLFTHILRFLVDIYVCCLKREDSLPGLSRVFLYPDCFARPQKENGGRKRAFWFFICFFQSLR